MAAVAASGEQFEIALGDQRAVVVEVGGGLREYSEAGRDILDGYGTDEICPSGRGQVLSPFPNRVQDGNYEFDGRQHQLLLDEPQSGNAIHGLVRWSLWSAAEQEPDRVAMEHTLHPRPGYPFALASSRVLAVAWRAAGAKHRHQRGGGAVPLRDRGASLPDPGHRARRHGDAALSRETVLRADERGIPTGDVPVAGTEYDFRQARPIGATRLDNCFTDLDRDPDGLARVELGDLELWMDAAYPYVMLFTGDPLPDVARRSLAIEPMTCPPNAFRTGRDLIRLEPGQSTVSTWGIHPPT